MPGAGVPHAALQGIPKFRLRSGRTSHDGVKGFLCGITLPRNTSLPDKLLQVRRLVRGGKSQAVPVVRKTAGRVGQARRQFLPIGPAGVDPQTQGRFGNERLQISAGLDLGVAGREVVNKPARLGKPHREQLPAVFDFRCEKSVIPGLVFQGRHLAQHRIAKAAQGGAKSGFRGLHGPV